MKNKEDDSWRALECQKVINFHKDTHDIKGRKIKVLGCNENLDPKFSVPNYPYLYEAGGLYYIKGYDSNPFSTIKKARYAYINDHTRERRVPNGDKLLETFRGFKFKLAYPEALVLHVEDCIMYARHAKELTDYVIISNEPHAKKIISGFRVLSADLNKYEKSFAKIGVDSTKVATVREFKKIESLLDRYLDLRAGSVRHYIAIHDLKQLSKKYKEAFYSYTKSLKHIEILQNTVKKYEKAMEELDKENLQLKFQMLGQAVVNILSIIALFKIARVGWSLVASVSAITANEILDKNLGHTKDDDFELINIQKGLLAISAAADAGDDILGQSSEFAEKYKEKIINRGYSVDKLRKGLKKIKHTSAYAAIVLDIVDWSSEYGSISEAKKNLNKMFDEAGVENHLVLEEFSNEEHQTSMMRISIDIEKEKKALLSNKWLKFEIMDILSY